MMTNKEKRQMAYNGLEELLQEIFSLEFDGTLFSDEVTEMCKRITYAQEALMEESN